MIRQNYKRAVHDGNTPFAQFDNPTSLESKLDIYEYENQEDERHNNTMTITDITRGYGTYKRYDL